MHGEVIGSVVSFYLGLTSISSLLSSFSVKLASWPLVIGAGLKAHVMKVQVSALITFSVIIYSVRNV